MTKTRQFLALSMAALALVLPPLQAGAGAANLMKQLGDSVADVVDEVMPSVVVVRTEAVHYRIARDYYWGLFGIPERLAGQGSGVLISKDGFVLTNSHVIDKAEEIEIVLNDGSKYPARLVGQDPHTDIAVLKIEEAKGREFDPVEVGDSDELRVGEFVVAIGSPFSLSSSVTLGIVSQKGRNIGALPYEDFIQSDAAVNPGNSGGPLVDAEGRMVGINTMIQTSGYSEGSIGISFAIPVNLAMSVAQAIMKDGKWQRPWLGISMDEQDGQVLVADIVPSSPAAVVGVKSGDVISEVDGRTVTSSRDVQRAVLRRLVGEKVSMTVLRNERKVEFMIVTDTMPPPLYPYRR